MALHIRPGTLADEGAAVAFNVAMALETEGKTLHEPTLRAGVRAALADPAKGFYLMAERGGEVVGQLMVTTEWSDWRNGWYWWIQSVYVKPEARGAGVFRALFEHLKAKAVADPSIIGMRLYVEHDNARAKAVYAKLGLSEEPYHLMGVYPLPGRESAFV
ncbi:MAG: GNAT family N-acetyltransferase [Fimbriiglobus sp.]|jgi:ribosomal protein S18 acetylase RimI-like enzyme|nr:GNAT family N-acetyltransferase [Fimbriiglobus sp.]